MTFDEGLAVANEDGDDLVAIHEALDAVAHVDERKSRVIELRFFGDPLTDPLTGGRSPRRTDADGSQAAKDLKHRNDRTSLDVRPSSLNLRVLGSIPRRLTTNHSHF